MKFCRDEYDTEKGLYRCAECGSEMPSPTIRQCPFTGVVERESKTVNYLTCPHRGKVLTTISGRTAGYGCSSTPVEVYQCNQFNEPVLKQAAPRCLEKIQGKVPGYTGRTCRECKAVMSPPQTVSTAPTHPAVGVVVTCHNYARFLRQCLDSILAQSVKPSAIVLVDDASEDETPSIGAEYAKRGIRYERVEFRDASQSRNHGASLVKGADYWLFVDADNWLPPNYLVELLKLATEPSTGVVYCRLWHVDEQGKDMGWSKQIKPFSLANLRRQNLADTCSLVRKQAFDQVGGWNRDRWGLQDWDLWLRIADAGWHFKYCETTALSYRIHSQQMTLLNRRKWESGMEVTRDSMLTTIITLFSGRSWNLGRWFYDLRNVRWNKKNLHLIAVDNSRDHQFSRDLRDQLENCGVGYTYLQDDSRIIEEVPAHQFTDSAKQRTSHVRAMNEHMARLYSLATRYVPNSTANVWSIEDDVGFPPDTLEVLAAEAYRLQPEAVSGCLRNRFAGQRILAWTGPNRWVEQVPSQSIKVTGIGFFCMFCRRDAWDRIAWRAGVTGKDKHLYYDWAACHDILRQGPIYLAPVRCKHWLADGGVIEC